MSSVNSGDFTDDSVEYEAEAILDKRVSACGRRVHYLVKWKNYPIEESTWEPPMNLVNCRALIRQFESARMRQENPFRVPKKKERRSIKRCCTKSRTEKDDNTKPLTQSDEHLAASPFSSPIAAFESSPTLQDETVGVKFEALDGNMENLQQNKAERYAYVSRIIRMDNTAGEETAFEVEFDNGHTEWLSYMDAHQYLWKHLLDFYEILLAVNGGQKYNELNSKGRYSREEEGSPLFILFSSVRRKIFRAGAMSIIFGVMSLDEGEIKKKPCAHLNIA